MLTLNIFLHFQHSSEKVNMRLNRNVQYQYRFNIGSFSNLQFDNHTQKSGYFQMRKHL